MSAPPNPPRPWVGTERAAKGHYAFWTDPPPDMSARCRWWIERIRSGWTPTGRMCRQGYDSDAEMFGVYLFEYLHVLTAEMHPDWKDEEHAEVDGKMVRVYPGTRWPWVE